MATGQVTDAIDTLTSAAPTFLRGARASGRARRLPVPRHRHRPVRTVLSPGLPRRAYQGASVPVMPGDVPGLPGPRLPLDIPRMIIPDRGLRIDQLQNFRRRGAAKSAPVGRAIGTGDSRRDLVATGESLQAALGEMAFQDGPRFGLTWGGARRRSWQVRRTVRLLGAR